MASQNNPTILKRIAIIFFPLLARIKYNARWQLGPHFVVLVVSSRASELLPDCKVCLRVVDLLDSTI